MAKFTYRGVSYTSDDKPKNAHDHGDGLIYRGHAYDGYEADKAAAPGKPSFVARIYRGVRKFI